MKVVNIRRLGYFTRKKAGRVANTGEVLSFADFRRNLALSRMELTFTFRLGLRRFRCSTMKALSEMAIYTGH